jgi:hypothetical protein
VKLADLGERLGFFQEGGVLAIAVSPESGHAYVHYTDEDGTSRIIEFEIDGSGLALESEREVLAVEHPGRVHNGGAIAFGPDGYLYLGFGDGGEGAPDADRVDDLGKFDGKLLRIDPRPVNGAPYRVPPDNPYVDTADARPEIWLTGVRNPWQFSFDRQSQDLWLGDVGSNCWEEIDHLVAGGRGADLGYPRYEAFHGFLAEEVDDSTFPLYAYSHDEGCALVGGVVVRSHDLPSLDGRYIFSDYCSRGVRWLEATSDGVMVGDLDVDVAAIQAFAEDAEGRVYLLSAADGVLRLTEP